ncbi:MAG: T9SS type A sorting domain-containing protein [Bacteroidota bacterium]|nr:T9SS type A sorting domain-containing protein [Bacteroidota bacterium]
MPNKYTILRSIALSLFFLFLGITATSQTITFTATPINYTSIYGGRTVFAAWITDVNGTNLKTLDCHASIYISYLYYWKSSFNWGPVDATTGATYVSIPAFSTNWDMKGRDGKVIADGKYYFNVEYCQSGSSRYTQYEFTKSSGSRTFSFPNSGYFNNVSVSVSMPSAVNSTTVSVPYNCYVVPGDKLLKIDYDPDVHNQVKAFVYDAKGMMQQTTRMNVGDGHLEFNLAELINGVYFVKIIDEKHYTETHKILLH